MPQNPQPQHLPTSPLEAIPLYNDPINSNGLLEHRIETTFQVVSILKGWAGGGAHNVYLLVEVSDRASSRMARACLLLNSMSLRSREFLRRARIRLS